MVKRQDIRNSHKVIRASVSKAFKPFKNSSRFKVAYGGRGSGKSHYFAKSMIILCMSKKVRCLCTREVQKSISDSVHRLLVDQIDLLGLSGHFEIQRDRIVCKTTGSEIIFFGLYRNVTKVKSLEGIDVCWAEEAEAISFDSWEILIPSIRKDDSEIWVSFNPKYEDDDTYRRFVTEPGPRHYPSGKCKACGYMIDNSEDRLQRACPKCKERGVTSYVQFKNWMTVIKVNYDQNKWFNEVLRTEMENDKKTNPDLYKQKWLGEPSGGGGLIWTAFDKSIHVKDFSWDYLSKGNAFMAMDPHSKYYPAVVWIAMIPFGSDYRYVVYNEYPTVSRIEGYYSTQRKKLYYDGSIKDLATELFAGDMADKGMHVMKRVLDTRFAKSSGGSNWSTATAGIVSQFALPKNGSMRLDMPYEKDIDVQRSVIQEMMQYNKMQTLSEVNQPQLYIMPHCKNVIQSLSLHRTVMDSEKEDEKHKDFSDALRIGFAGMLRWSFRHPTDNETTDVFQSEFPAYGEQSWMGV